MKRARFVMALLAGSGCGIVAAGGTDTHDTHGPDIELLEFLGSWEGRDEEWQEFFDSLPPAHESTLQAGKPEIGDRQENDR